MSGFADNVASRPTHAAVVEAGRVTTYAQLDADADRLAGALVAAGVEAGGRMAVMLANSTAFVASLAASAKLGASCLTLNWHLRSDEVAWILDDSGAAALVSDRALGPQVESVTTGRSVPVLWADALPGDGGAAGTAPVAARPDRFPDRFPYRFPAPWSVLYTSGTSGRPKGVVHGAMADPEVIAMVQGALADMWGYGPDDVHLVAGPMYHAGPAGYANSTLFVGGTVVLMGGWEAREFLRLVEAHRVTTTFLTPAHFIRLLEVPDDERARYDLSSLRHVIHAGAPCPVGVKRRIIAALPAAEVWELYGMSEGGATRVSGADWLEHPGTVGRPWPGVEIRILDPATLAPVAAGQEGLVYVRPAHGRFEYHNDPDKTAATWLDDAFTVGDVGRLDDGGYLYLTDRLSDLVIRSGVNIYPRMVEEALHTHPAVVDCAVFGVPDERDGEVPVAVVEVRQAATPDELARWCRDRLDPYSCPVRIDLVDTLPRDPERQGAQAAAARGGVGRGRAEDLTMADDAPTDADVQPDVQPDDGLGPDAWLRVADDGEATLVGGWSATSGRAHFPPAPLCPYSGADDVERLDLPRRGTLWAWTAVTTAPPGYEGPVPFGFGIVELEAVGLRLVTRLTVADIGALWFGQPARLVAEELPTGAAGVGLRPGPRGEGRGIVSTGVEIVGVGLHRFGRFGDTTATELGVRAVRRALGDAGWSIGEARARVGATFCATAYGGVAAGHRVLGALALTGMPIIDVEAGCASGGAALALAATALRSGQHDAVLVVGVEKMPKGIIRSSFFEPWREQAGLAATPAYFALRAQRLLREHGLTVDDLAALVVKNRGVGGAQPRRHVPHRRHRRGGAGLADGVRPPAPVDAVLTQRGGGGDGAAPLRRGRPAGRRRVAQPPARQRARRVDPPGRHRRHRDNAPHRAGRDRRLRDRRDRPHRSRRGGVPGHRCRPRAAVVDRAGLVRAGRAAGPAAGRGGRPGRDPVGSGHQPVGRAALQR